MSSIVVRTEISGMVSKVVVKMGDHAMQGDTLVVIESMKMEIPVEAPRDGVVGEICVQVGGLVDEGDVLLVLI